MEGWLKAFAVEPNGPEHKMANPKLKMATTVHWTYIPFRSLYFMRKKTKNHEKNIEVPDLA